MMRYNIKSTTIIAVAIVGIFSIGLGSILITTSAEQSSEDSSINTNTEYDAATGMHVDKVQSISVPNVLIQEAESADSSIEQVTVIEDGQAENILNVEVCKMYGGSIYFDEDSQTYQCS